MTAGELTRTSRLTSGRLLILAAALLWSSSGAYVKSPVLTALPQESRGLTIAFFRALFAGLILLPLIRRAAVRWRWAMLPMMLSFAAMNALFVSSMTFTTAANAILLQYTAPIWMFLGSVLLLREPMQRNNLVSLIAGMLGVAVILAATWQTPEARGVAMALAAGVAYAGVTLCLRVLRDEGSSWLICLNHLASAAVLVPWMLTSADLPRLATAHSKDPAAPYSLVVTLAVLFCFGLTQMAVPYVLFSRGLKSVSPQEAGAIGLIEPILNPLWVFLLWQEPVQPATFVGGAFILAGLAWRYVVPAR